MSSATQAGYLSPEASLGEVYEASLSNEELSWYLSPEEQSGSWAREIGVGVASSVGVPSSVGVSAKISQFRLQRKEVRYKRFARFAKLGGGLVAGAAATQAVTLALMKTEVAGVGGGLVATVVTAVFLFAGLLLLTACPPDVMDLNEVLVSSVALRRAVSAVLVLSSTAAILPPHGHAAVLLPALGLLGPSSTLLGVDRGTRDPLSSGSSEAALELRSAGAMVAGVGRMRGCFLPCTLLTASMHAFVLATCAWYGLFFRNAQEPKVVMLCGPRSVEVLQMLAVATAIGSLIAAGVSFCFVGCRRLGSTERLYYAMYVTTIELGILCFAPGLACPGDTRPPLVAIGLVLIVPSAVLMKARTSVFTYLARTLEQKLAVADGAFIAELLEDRKLRVGNEWWLHHGRQDPTFAELDHRRNWTKGHIVQVGIETFCVRALREKSREASTSMSLSSRSGVRVLPQEDCVDNTVTVPIVSRGSSAESLLALAHANLRCIDWSGLSLDLMSGKICGAAAPSNKHSGNLAGTSLISGDLYDLSRAVKPGEVVDFFMSHSWHDDAEEKWGVLTMLATTFYRVHGRYPTFWLDKVCINQCNIAEGLKVLPVNVMACKQMVVLCGPSYPERLWCAWELCTMFSFMPLQVALDRIVVVPLTKRSVGGNAVEEDSMAKLGIFDILGCRCYDPNEEAVLMRMVKTVGVTHFNGRLRTLARACAKEPRNRNSRMSVGRVPALFGGP